MKKNEIIEDVKRSSRIEAVTKTEGGKIILESLKRDITTSISELSRGYKTLTHIEMIALTAKLSEQLILLRVLNNSSKLKKLAQDELDFLLEEEKI